MVITINTCLFRFIWWQDPTKLFACINSFHSHIQGLVTFDSTVIEHLLVPGLKDPKLNKTKTPALMGLTF